MPAVEVFGILARNAAAVRAGRGAHPSAKFPVGPRAPAESGELAVAGPSLGRMSSWPLFSPSARPTDWRRREPAGTTAPCSVAITRFWPCRRHRRRADRLRQGRAKTSRGAAHFLRETISRVRYAATTGQLSVRPDSGFYIRSIATVCRNQGVRFSIPSRTAPCLPE